MKNRRWMLAAAGLAAATAGAGWQVLRDRAQQRALAPETPDAPAGDATVAPDFWQASFPQPDGAPLVLQSLRGAPLVLNFWATWCAPCVKEMPELDRFARAHAAQGVRVVGLAIDSPTPVRDYLKRAPVSYPIALAGFGGTDLSRKLGNAKGALPFTAVFDRSGRLRHQKLGETGFDELARWIAAL